MPSRLCALLSNREKKEFVKKKKKISVSGCAVGYIGVSAVSIPFGAAFSFTHFAVCSRLHHHFPIQFAFSYAHDLTSRHTSTKCIQQSQYELVAHFVLRKDCCFSFRVLNIYAVYDDSYRGNERHTPDVIVKKEKRTESVASCISLSLCVCVIEHAVRANDFHPPEKKTFLAHSQTHRHTYIGRRERGRLLCVSRRKRPTRKLPIKALE